MSSLPFLSHHLFAAAVGRREPAPRSSPRSDLPPLAAENGTPAAPLEVIAAAEPMPLGTARPVRKALILGRS